MKSIGSEEFFKKIAIHANIMDVETVRDVYYGMIRTISRELKDTGIIKLPEWGNFYLNIHKERRSNDLASRTIKILPAKTTVKFSPIDKVKKYFHKWGEGGL